MSIVTIDRKGRIVIPSKLRRKLGLREGDPLIVLLRLDNNLIVLRKVDVERLVKEVAENVAKAGLGFGEIERGIEDEANRLAQRRLRCFYTSPQRGNAGK